ncbi:PP2C family protein-serine/threonine phosphatase [Salinimicrobium sp. CAU 1759]|jgi:protein phosphatase
MITLTVSNKGKRENNQDLILEYTATDNSYLFAVIDGMGGYKNGEIAAEIICENIKTYLSTVETINAFHIQKAINKSSLAIRQQKDNSSNGMGATIGGVFLQGTVVTYFWIGDVKIFHFRNNKLLFESTSHSLVNDLIENGTMTDSFQLSRYKHVVTRSIKGDIKSSLADFHTKDFHDESDLLLVCSDGVSDLFEGLQIENLLNQIRSTRTFKREMELRLIREASDNFTFGIITSNTFEGFK